MEFLSVKITFFFWMHLTLLIVMAAGFCQWLLLYIYAIFLPILIILRAWFYFKLKWQLFLVDLCYCINLVLYIYIWVGPSVPEFLYVIFGISHGPVLTAAITFRNSLVFHSMDRMTSCFIHLMPPLLTFGIRWYPDRITHWIAPFISNQDLNLTEQSFWIFALPLAILVFHTAVYLSFLVIVRPSEEYVGFYSYLTEGSSGIWPTIFKKFARKWRPFLYILLILTIGGTSVLLNFLWYNYFYANLTVLCLVFSRLIWNASTFYVDVFRKKGMDSEPYSVLWCSTWCDEQPDTRSANKVK
ncbi:uncharacterized protein [Apostichopus japonicus]|uniref:uncharacterized protein n=1 Tax=Stichopus japonicus TaxID=307972 RepID=UPI003AB2A98D